MVNAKILMKQCPICDFVSPETAPGCECGYDFETKGVGDTFNIQKSYEWHKKVRQIKIAHENLIKKYGSKTSTRKDADGWSKRMTATRLRVSPSKIVQDIALAEALEDYPELRKFKTKSAAFKSFKMKKEKVSNIETEDEAKSKSFIEDETALKDFFRSRWENTPLYKEWELREVEYETGAIGRIDLLTHHRNEPRWRVIELKLLKSNDETVGQLLRYMGWVKENLSTEDEKIEGLIIVKSADESIRYALRCVPNIHMMKYSFKGGNLILKELKTDLDYLMDLTGRLEPEQRDKLIETLRGLSHKGDVNRILSNDLKKD
jgi:hypothetical protein